LDWQAGLLILPVMYVIYRSYHLYLDQLQSERKRAEEERKHAQEVASLHARAMESLGSAMSANAKLEAVIQASPLAIPALDRKRLEAQLRLSQKMEAVGGLAGGIAHDFNILLTVINGYGAMLVDSLKDERYAGSQAEEILNAGNRAAELVSQLLTFSGRQLIKPKSFEINHLVQDVERMLRRIIGEHIEFRTQLDPEAGWIQADVNQMETVLLNLATNARDAMPDGGVLSIETTHVEVVAVRRKWSQEPPPGSYVRIVVR